MPKATLNIGSQSFGYLALETDRVHGIGGPAYPRLRISLEITLSPYRRWVKQDEVVTHPITVLAFWGDLEVDHRAVGEFREETSLYADADFTYPRQVDLQVPLDLFRVGEIEKARKANFQATLNIKYRVLIHNRGEAPVSEFHIGSTPLSFEIAKSHWIETVLPALGHGKLEIVTVHMPDPGQLNGLPKTVGELKKAQKYLTEGEWDKAVASCRTAVEAVITSKKVKLSPGQHSFAKKVDAFVAQHLGGRIGKAQGEILAEQVKSVWRVASSAHHAMANSSFTRADAEFLVRISTALAEYVSKLLA